VADELYREAKRAGIERKEVSVGDIYEKHMEKEYQDDYEMVRGPR